MDINIREFRKKISEKYLLENELTITSNGKPIAKLMPVGKFAPLNLMNQKLDSIIDMVAELKNSPVGSAPSENFPSKCQQPGCNERTTNPPRNVTFDFEPRVMVLCDVHYSAATSVQ